MDLFLQKWVLGRGRRDPEMKLKRSGRDAHKGGPPATIKNGHLSWLHYLHGEHAHEESKRRQTETAGPNEVKKKKEDCAEERREAPQSHTDKKKKGSKTQNKASAGGGRQQKKKPAAREKELGSP